MNARDGYGFIRKKIRRRQTKRERAADEKRQAGEKSETIFPPNQFFGHGQPEKARRGNPQNDGKTEPNSSRAETVELISDFEQRDPK